MLELGKKQTLKINRLTSVGAYLSDSKDLEEVLLPTKQIPKGADVGDEVEVFIYKDSEDRIIATIKNPLITIGNIALLKVIDVNKIGAFLDWGLEKDLFLPFTEQTTRVKKGKIYPVSLYIDKSKRLSATMKIYKLLENNAPYKVNDQVEGVVYDVKRDIGAFVVIDTKYHGLIPIHEWHESDGIGKYIQGRVSSIREDGKLNISLKEKAYIQMDKDVEILLELMEKNGGILFLNDNSDPETIRKVTNLSKSAFKRAVGRLLKQKRIEITEKGIKLI